MVNQAGFVTSTGKENSGDTLGIISWLNHA
jgi:hypothetical protein